MELKKEIRKEIRAKVKGMYGWEKDYYGKKVLQAVEAESSFIEAKIVLLFWSLPDEVNTHDFILRWSKEKKILLPVVIGDDSEVCEFKGIESMKRGAFDIDEPVGDRFTEYASIDLVIVPGMGFDRSGNRLGRGKGYYDKLLKRMNCPKIGICFPCQILPEIPHEEWDVKMDKVILLNY